MEFETLLVVSFVVLLAVAAVPARGRGERFALLYGWGLLMAIGGLIGG